MVIEGGAKMGGLCILRGCMPSKTLLESAHRWHEINRAREFCLVAKPVKVDMKCIHSRKEHLIGGFASYRRKQLKDGKFTLVRGMASFLDPHTLLVTHGPQAGAGDGLGVHHRDGFGGHARAGSGPVGNGLLDQRRRARGGRRFRSGWRCSAAA